MSLTPRQEPLILDVDTAPLPEVPTPADAPEVPEPGEMPAAEQALHAAARGMGWGLGRVALALTGALVVLLLGIAAQDFVAALFARADALGWLAMALLAALAVVVLLAVLREGAGLARIRRIDGIRVRAEDAQGTVSPDPARGVAAEITGLYAGRPGFEARRRSIETAIAEVSDGPDLLGIVERQALTPLDAEAARAVSRAARTVAATTALLPMPLIDVVAVLTINLGMIRRIAEVYGGRAGWLGSWRLMRAVAGHLVATGAISATDDLLGPMLGGGLLGRLSRRFGEAAVNSALTARVGTAAIAVCRPMPFAACAAPRASVLVLDALRGWPRERG